MRFSRAIPALLLLTLPTLTVALAAPASAREVVPHRAARYLGPLTDLHPDKVEITDGGVGGAVAVTTASGTFVWLGLGALDPAAEGRTYGAHVHTGPCVAGEPDTAGPHLMAGTPPSPATELWLDVTIQSRGWATAATTVAFTVPQGGAGSIVVHARPTDRTGAAGDRLACLPLAL
jgi:Cu/Zn superoxide dismutase